MPTPRYYGMKIIRNRWLPAKKYDAINLFGLLFCHKDTLVTEELVFHERIHTAQMIEMLFIGFYVWYFIEWLVRIPLKGRAYINISFEREAYENMHDKAYLSHRRPYAWVKYLRRRH